MSDDASPPVPEALGQALRRLLGPLARLALAQGMTHQTLDELVKQALVQAADDTLADLPPHRRASRVTTITGIHRREVTRLLQLLRDGGMAQVPAQRSHASELFAHWRSHAEFCDGRGSPAELPRQGPSPSFEALAHAITRDVHPRSLLDELLRLGLAAWDRERDTVRLVREHFVPQGDDARMLRTLGANVGSHLSAAVDNVLVDDRSHFEQALYASGLSDASLAEWRRLVQRQWQALLDAMVPQLEAMVDRDAAAAADATHDAAGGAAAGPTRHRVRLGLYTHQQSDPTPTAPAAAGTAPRRPAGRPAAPRKAR